MINKKENENLLQFLTKILRFEKRMFNHFSWLDHGYGDLFTTLFKLLLCRGCRSQVRLLYRF